MVAKGASPDKGANTGSGAPQLCDSPRPSSVVGVCGEKGGAFEVVRSILAHLLSWAMHGYFHWLRTFHQQSMI